MCGYSSACTTTPILQKFAADTLADMQAGHPPRAHSLASYGFSDRFYQLSNCSDILAIAHIIARHQLLTRQETESYYALIFNIVRRDGKPYSQAEHQLFNQCSNFFLHDINQRLHSPPDCPLLPWLTGELIHRTDGHALCKRTSPIDLFNTGNKLSPRQLAAIRTCFDLKHQQRPVTRLEIARHLHLHEPKRQPTPILDQAPLNRVDDDLKAIKHHLLRDFPADSHTFNPNQKSPKLASFPDIFKAYAYFGLYPDPHNHYQSYLQNRLGKLKHKPLV